MNQTDINHFLQTSRMIAEDLEKDGKGDVSKRAAQKILANSSKAAEVALQVLKLPQKRLQCLRGHILKGPVSQDAWVHGGLCLWCEEGRCTKDEAVCAILSYVQGMLLSLKVEIPEGPEEENMYQARYIN